MALAPDRAAIKALEEALQAVLAAAGIRADGRVVHDMYLVEVKKPGESKKAWDYYRIVATIPAERAFRPAAAGNCPLVK